TDVLSISAPTGVELSLDGLSFGTTGTLTPSSGTVDVTTIDARISDTAEVGAITGPIANTSPGATPQDVDVTGTVNPVPVPTIVVSTTALDLGSTTAGTPGATHSLHDALPILTDVLSISAPTGVELSLDGLT